MFLGHHSVLRQRDLCRFWHKKINQVECRRLSVLTVLVPSEYTSFTLLFQGTEALYRELKLGVARKVSAIADNRIVSVHLCAVTPEIFVYKIVADNGGAPCVWRGLLSLALCKPKIRKSAGVGALIFGFGGKDYGERLIYVAEVTEKPRTGVYYQSLRFSSRPDCIYHAVDGEPQRKPNAQYHAESDQRRKDVGMLFKNADVLLSRSFRYFGRQGTAAYKDADDCRAITRLVENLKQGHRVNHSSELRRQLLNLKKRIWREFPEMKIGSPTESDRSKVCNADTPSTRC